MVIKISIYQNLNFVVGSNISYMKLSHLSLMYVTLILDNTCNIECRNHLILLKIYWLLNFLYAYFHGQMILMKQSCNMSKFSRIEIQYFEENLDDVA